MRSFLLGLLQYFSRTVSSPSGKVDDIDETVSQAVQLSEPSVPPSNLVESAPVSSVSNSSASTSSNHSSIDMPPLSELGEMPAVQDHFQTILKRRLQVEIDQRPPLFPWESDLHEYPIELSSSAYPWLAQLRSLQLPTALPEDMLPGLLNRCQELVLESLKPGLQLVKAVESLFPDQPQAMHQIAGLVLADAAPVRGTGTQDVEALQTAFPDGYVGANPQQQVTLAMLAAKEILEALTITLTPQQPAVQREWLTTNGTITLTAQLQTTPNRDICLTVDVPQAAQLRLPSIEQSVQHNQAGRLELRLPEPQVGVPYPLEIAFDTDDTVPLEFAIRWLEQ